MNETGAKALLPAGLQDVLAPQAAHEAAVVERLIASFAGQGYERVKPPLMEFEEGLLSGAGAALAQETFRLMDPVSQRMMALRADTTPQVARIAASRLAHAARPLRLCYGGQVLRVRGTQLRPERQFGQVGAEIIGTARAEADAEVVLMAVEALANVGVQDLTVDLTQPTLVAAVAAGLGLEADLTEALKGALDRKDSAEVEALAGAGAGLFLSLLRAGGPAEAALERLAALSLPPAAEAEVAALDQVARLVRQAAPGLSLSVDPVEHRSFEYQSGVSFTLFARGVRGELGRGGRYFTEFPGAASEPATGFSLYMDTVLRALPRARRPQSLFLPWGTTRAKGEEMRSNGWITLAGLEEAADPRAEARRMGCTHILVADRVEELEA